MITTSVEQLAEPIGFDIANSNDTVQANLINGLGRGFKYMRDENLAMQLCYLSNKLDKDGEKFITELYEYVKLKNQ